MTPGDVDPLMITQINEVPRGAVVVVRSRDADFYTHLVADMHASLAATIGHQDFVLLLLRPADSLEVLDADAMAAAGWHRRPF